MGEYWSWALTAAGLAGLFLAGSKRRIGWLFGLAVQPLWIAFAIATKQYGFVLSALAYGFVYARNWWRWRREHGERLTAEPPPGATVQVITTPGIADGFVPPSASLDPPRPYRVDDFPRRPWPADTPTAEDVLAGLRPVAPKPPKLGAPWVADFPKPPKYVTDALEAAIDQKVRASFADRDATVAAIQLLEGLLRAEGRPTKPGVGDIDAEALARSVTRPLRVNISMPAADPCAVAEAISQRLVDRARGQWT